MSRPPVLNKQDYYRRAQAGEFGNILPRYFTLGDWARDGWAATEQAHRLWGVQHTKVAMFPGTKLDVRGDEVEERVRAYAFGPDYVISPMIHQYGAVAWEGNVSRGHEGLLLAEGNLNPKNGSWRQHMLAPRRWEGSAARLLLNFVLNDNSRDDVEELLDLYPDHVIELSAIDACFGTVPHRNAVIWEVRIY